MAGKAYTAQRPTQEHINKMVKRSKEVHLKQMEVLGSDNTTFNRVTMESHKNKKKRQKR